MDSGTFIETLRALIERWERHGDPADRDAAINCLTEAISAASAGLMTDLPAEIMVDLHAELTRLLADRASDQQPGPEQNGDLDAAIQHARAALACPGPEPEDPGPALEEERYQADGSTSSISMRAELRLLLGLVLTDRCTVWAAALDSAEASAVLAARACRDEAIDVLTSAFGEIPAGEPAWAVAADALGRVQYDRYTDPWPGAPPPVQADLDTAIDLLAATVTVEPEPRSVSYLVFALADRLAIRSDTDDLDQFILWCQRLLDIEPPADADGEFFRIMLSTALMDRANTSPHTHGADLDAAIGHLETALAHTSATDPDRPEVLANLAHACWRRLDGDDSRYDRVDQMTSYAEQAWAVLPADAEDRALIGLYFATGIHERLLRPAADFDVPAVSRAIAVLAEIAPMLAGDRDVHLIVAVTLGHFLAARGQATGAPADIAAAKPWLLGAAADLPADDPGWSEITQTLAGGLSILAGLGMDVDDLDQAIAVLATAVGRPHPDPARAAMARGTLGLLLIQRASFTASWRDLDDGISHLAASHDMAPLGDAYRAATGVNLASALLTRFLERGQAEDVDAARFYLAMAETLAGPGGNEVRSLMADADMVIAGNKGLLAIVDGMRGDPAALDEAVTSLRAALAALPPSHPHRGRIRADLGFALAIRAMSTSRKPGDLEEAGRQMGTAIAALAAGHLMRPVALLRAGGTLAAAAAAAGDQRSLRQAIRYLSDALGELDPQFGGRFRFTAVLGAAALALHRHSGDPADLADAITWLESARRELGGRPSHPQSANCVIILARAYRARGDAGAARETGLDALHARARDLLLQSGTARSVGFARLAAAEAADVAAWCLADGRPEGAVAALELGRGLILHASTCVMGIPELLTSTGHEDLAQDWREAAARTGDALWDTGVPGAEHLPGLLAGAGLDVPDDLRAKVFAALAGSPAEQILLAPPSPGELAVALKETGADALVYLLGFSGGQPGRAVVLTAAGLTAADAAAPVQIPLPPQRGPEDKVQAYAAAYTALLASQNGHRDGRRQAIAHWREALTDLCDWAWTAGMQPILSLTRSWQLSRPPRLVLIPAGALSLVPWHAARHSVAGDGRSRYALHDAVISYAASGRQLREVAARPTLPLDASPVVVGDPTGTLPGALLESHAILARCYPGGLYLGRDLPGWDPTAAGPGTPGEVLRQLPAAGRPGASMLHLGCHGVVAGSAPGQSHLLMAGYQELRVDAILRQASGRPPASAGGLVSLAACSSDLALGEYDEALTPATAFLAAGAVTVVGARWHVPDEATSLLMFMFHYFMRQRAHLPRDALRAAQLWLLDPARALPPEMPGELAERARRAEAADITAWAGMVHQGQ